MIQLTYLCARIRRLNKRLEWAIKLGADTLTIESELDNAVRELHTALQLVNR